jgi:beta-1,4-galactosyltransferase 3
MYSCPANRPRHLSVAIDKYEYKMLYPKLVGGVLNFKTVHFLKVNGYSNQYWGWGEF